MPLVDWAHSYRPLVRIGATDFDLPLPILRWSERLTNKFKSITVPLQDGVAMSNVQRGAAVINISGTINTNTRSGLIQKRLRMQELFLDSAGQTFTLYRFYDAARSNYVWYEDCVCQDIGFDFSNNRLFTADYTMTVVAPHGTMRHLLTTVGEAPGPTGNISGVYRDGAYQGDNYSDSIADSLLPENRLYLFGPLLLKLTTADSNSAFLIRNSAGQYVLKITGDGTIQSVAPVEIVETISAPS